MGKPPSQQTRAEKLANLAKARAKWRRMSKASRKRKK